MKIHSDEGKRSFFACRRDRMLTRHEDSSQVRSAFGRPCGGLTVSTPWPCDPVLCSSGAKACCLMVRDFRDGPKIPHGYKALHMFLCLTKNVLYNFS